MVQSTLEQSLLTLSIMYVRGLVMLSVKKKKTD